VGKPEEEGNLCGEKQNTNGTITKQMKIFCQTLINQFIKKNQNYINK
jgi:hypothetical protein